MQLRFILAVFLSIALVGLASWYRFGVESYTQPVDLAALESTSIDSEYYSDEAFLEEFLKPKATSTVAVAEDLSSTDIVGRQLILDYVNLAASGGASISSINALADKYVDSIPSLNKAEPLNITDIKIVADSKVNFQNYAEVITDIHNSYAQELVGLGISGVGLNTLGPELYAFTKAFSQAYKKAAFRLESLPVPQSLASKHLELINSYLSSAAAMESIAHTEEDSAEALAGIIVLKTNLDKEDSLLVEISDILTLNEL